MTKKLKPGGIFCGTITSIRAPEGDDLKAAVDRFCERNGLAANVEPDDGFPE